jgi:archaemetzincin
MRTPLALAILIVCACSSHGDAPRDKKSPRRGTDGDGPPLVPAIGDTTGLSPQLQRAFDPAVDFTPMPVTPEPGTWRAAHPEEPQSYDDFMKGATPMPDATRKVLYLLPLGDFPSTAPPLDALARVVKAFYMLEVRTLPAVPLADVKVTTRINSSTQRRQLLAPDVLRWMKPRLPADAFSLIAVTMEDLYPDPKWNFVFGQASLQERVGVQSFARQDPAFFNEKRGPGWEKLALRRAVWTMVHEIAHTFGLHHCQYYECVVAGSNSQAESDGRPLHACPVCGRKLQAVLDFDPATREAELATVLEGLGIDDEAAWSRKRAKWIREGVR